MSAYEPRIYRSRTDPAGLQSFRVVVEETDLLISVDRAEDKVKKAARECVLSIRSQIKHQIARDSVFSKSFVPCEIGEGAEPIIRAMSEAATLAHVGPMAAVAGAVADFVGASLLPYSRNVIVENGGDIFITGESERTVEIGAGKSPLNGKIGISIPAGAQPIGVCTSSGTVGHSFSSGKADAAVVASRTAAVADAFATAIANKVRGESDIDEAIDFAQKAEGVIFAAIVVGSKIGIWGEFEIVPLRAS